MVWYLFLRPGEKARAGTQTLEESILHRLRVTGRVTHLQTPRLIPAAITLVLTVGIILACVSVCARAFRGHYCSEARSQHCWRLPDQIISSR